MKGGKIFMKALLVKVGESPKEISIRKNKNGSIYDKLTELVDGYLECIDIYTESGSETTIICDEEAKLKHKPLNRKLTLDLITGNGEDIWQDAIAGDFVILNYDFEKDDWAGLSKDEIEYLQKKLDNNSIFIEPFQMDYEL